MNLPGDSIGESKYFIPVSDMQRTALQILLCLPLLMLTVSLSSAKDGQSVEQRLEKLERLMEGQGLADILMRLNALEEEVRQLRGQNEEQAHTIEQLKKRQRELYIDLDRRLLQLERGESGGVSGVAPAPLKSQPSDVSKPSTNKTPQPAQTNIPATGTPVVSPTARKNEREAYQEAFDLLRELEYDKAIAAFSSFLQDYPDGRYAHIARYWLGEANYAQRHFKEAISNYQSLIEHYPKSPKVAEAMLKIGYSHYNLNQDKAAQEVLEKLIDRYPGTTESSQARNLLQKIRARQSDG
jgi:tol-pal system protein YbgF